MIKETLYTTDSYLREEFKIEDSGSEVQAKTQNRLPALSVP